MWFGVFLASAVLVALFAPLEKTLGLNSRLVYFHGAWVWAAMLTFVWAAAVGLAGLISRRQLFHLWSRGLGRSALSFWVLFLPMSLYVMQANWNGLFLDEPRFRLPLNFAVVGLLLQMGMSFFPLVWTSFGNLIFAAALILGMQSIQTVLHPESPIFQSSAFGIQAYFALQVIFLLLAAIQLGRGWRGLRNPSSKGVP